SNPGKCPVLFIGFVIILPDQKRQSVFILLSFHNKDEIYVHEVISGISEIIQYFTDIRLFPYFGGAVLSGQHLADLSAVKVCQEIWRMGGKDHLTLSGKPVKDISCHLLQLWMKENLRIFHEDQVSSRYFCLLAGLQK